MAKPTLLPEWAIGPGANIVDPGLSRKQVGWQFLDYPPHEWQNWWQNLVFQWIEFFDNETDPFRIASTDSQQDAQDRASLVIDILNDASVELNAAILRIYNEGGGAIQLAPGTYNFDTTLTLRAGVIVRGSRFGASARTTFFNRANIADMILNATPDGSTALIDVQMNLNQTFPGNAISGINAQTSMIKNVKVFNGDFGTFAFNGCRNLIGCEVEDVGNGYNNCNYLNDCTQISTGGFLGNGFGFNNCDYVTNCFTNGVDTGYLGDSQYLYGCRADNSGNFGFESISFAVNCYALSCSRAGFVDSTYLQNCESDSSDVGFNNCSQLTSCLSRGNTDTFAQAFSGSGFNQCFRLSSCNAFNNSDNGFLECRGITASIAQTNDIGYSNCTLLSSCLAIDNSTVGFFDIEGGTANYATNSGIGFQSCRGLQSNNSNGNTTEYLNSYATWDTSGTAIGTAGDLPGGANTTGFNGSVAL